MSQTELEHKNQQLEGKDRQIEELNARRAESNAALMAVPGRRFRPLRGELAAPLYRARKKAPQIKGFLPPNA